MEGTILGMPRRTALYVIGGAVVLVVVGLALRGRSAASGGAPLAGGDAGLPVGSVPVTPGGLLQQREEQQAAYEQQMMDLSLQSARQQAELEGKAGQLQGSLLDAQLVQAKAVLDKLRRMDPKKLVHCPSGDPRIDPATGQLYCRTEESKGFIGDYVTPALGGAIGGAIRAGGAYYGGSMTIPGRGSYGTPPIVPWRV